MRFKLIIVFVEDAKTDEVAEAAKAAGATGCTRINSASGEGMEVKRTFLGLTLETTYTGKAMAALLADWRRGEAFNPLYWHTYNSADMGKFLANADISALPVELRRIAGLTN